MNEQDQADRFIHDVNSLLDGARRTDVESSPAEYRQMLDLARALTTTDFSGESRVRAAFRRRWLNRVDTQAAGKEPLTEPHRLHPGVLRRRLWVAVCGALALLLVLTFFYPGGPTVAAQSIGNGAKLIVLGAYSTAQKVEAYVTGQPLPEDSWSVRLFPGYGVGGNGLPGTNPTIRSTSDLQEAQKLTTFHIRTPGYLPAGYNLQEIKLAPIWTGAGAWVVAQNPNVFSFYTGPGPDIVLVQQPVGLQVGHDPNVAVGVLVGFLTNGTLEEVRVRGHAAAWADDHLLMWEEDSISFVVGGPRLALDEAVRIAESFR
jgi:hypothetical protein